MTATFDIGPHRVISELPAGALGRRFLTSVDARAAIVETTCLRGHDEVVERAIRRVEVMAALDHPHLVPVLDADLDGDVLFIVTPAPDRTALDAAAEVDLERTTRCLLAALAHLHDRGVIHRDVQRRHIGWFGGDVRLGGLGLSEVVMGGRTQGIGPIGGVLTMAPSIVRGEPATFGSDLFSLGAVVHLLATGEAVHDVRTESLADRLRRIAVEPPRLAPATPAALRPVIVAALAADGDADAGGAARLHAELTRLTSTTAGGHS